MDWLQAMGWVNIVEETRRSTVWAINPQLAVMFKEQRRAIIDARQRMKDNFHRDDIAAGTWVPTKNTVVIGNR